MTNYKERNSSYRDPVYALKDPIQKHISNHIRYNHPKITGTAE